MYQLCVFNHLFKIILVAPDIPQNVEANRDADNVLQMIWSPLKYGNCLVRYHVRYSNQNSTVDHRTSESKWVLYKAIGNITVAVNAEVNNKGGIFSEPITILATDPPTVVSPRGKGNSGITFFYNLKETFLTGK